MFLLEMEKCSIQKSFSHYHFAKTYELAKAETGSFMVAVKDLHDKLLETHIQTGHEPKGMIIYPRDKFLPLTVRDTIPLSVPRIDREPLNFHNIFGVITQVQNNLYRVGTKEGLIKGCFSRTDIAKSGTNSIFLNDLPLDTFRSLREDASNQSVSGGQGYEKCSCKAAKNQCKTKRWARFKTKILTNSRCHLSSPCCNK